MLVTLLNGTTGRRGLYVLPMGRTTNHVHVWKSLLEQAGFTLADIPKEWDAFWSFWCDQVQPAVRQATAATTSGASGLPCRSKRPTPRTGSGQFMHAYEADYVTRDGRLVIDEPEVRRQARQGDRQLHGDLPQGLHPARFGRLGRSAATTRQFLAQTVVMTLNMTLSIPNALKATRPDDYYKNAATIEWPRRRLRPAARHRTRHQPRRGLQGRGQRRHRQGVRALPGRRGLARPLSRLRRRPHAAADAEAASSSRSGWTRATRTGCARPCSS